MAATYNVALPTNRDKVRFVTQDTDTANAAFDDAELDYLLTKKGDDVDRAAAAALLILAGNKSKLAKRVAAGDYKEDLTLIAKNLREQAKAILEQAGMEPADLTAEIQSTDFAWRQFKANEALKGNL